MVSRGAGVDVVLSTYAGKEGVHAHLEGTQTCGSVWHCPVCAARIAEERRKELNLLLAVAHARGYQAHMITLTARHGREDDLAELLDRMKRAKQGWGQHRAYRRLKGRVIGSVTATEVTHGAVNGWHPHFHIIVVTDGPVDLEALRGPWLASLANVGLDGNGAAFQVQDASAAGKYVAKWGMAEEMTLTGSKRGRGKGRTPMQLLAAASDDGDKRAGALWKDYAAAFRGRRQLVWSRGLKALAGIGEVSDQDAAADERQDDQEEVGRLKISAEDWQPADKRVRGLQYRRAELLEAAEVHGKQGIAGMLAEVREARGFGRLRPRRPVEADPP